MFLNDTFETCEVQHFASHFVVSITVYVKVKTNI